MLVLVSLVRGVRAVGEEGDLGSATSHAEVIGAFTAIGAMLVSLRAELCDVRDMVDEVLPWANWMVRLRQGLARPLRDVASLAGMAACAFHSGDCACSSCVSGQPPGAA